MLPSCGTARRTTSWHDRLLLARSKKSTLPVKVWMTTSLLTRQLSCKLLVVLSNEARTNPAQSLTTARTRSLRIQALTHHQTFPRSTARSLCLLLPHQQPIPHANLPSAPRHSTTTEAHQTASPPFPKIPHKKPPSARMTVQQPPLPPQSPHPPAD